MEMDKKRRICPLRTIAKAIYGSKGEKFNEACIGALCEWWDGEDWKACSIFSIAQLKFECGLESCIDLVDLALKVKNVRARD